MLAKGIGSVCILFCFAGHLEQFKRKSIKIDATFLMANEAKTPSKRMNERLHFIECWTQNGETRGKLTGECNSQWQVIIMKNNAD